MSVKYFRPVLEQLQPFAIPSGEGMAKLHLNESPTGYPPEVISDLQVALAQSGEFHRYGDPYAGALRQAVAAYAGVQPEQVLFGNGSDELIFLLHLACGGPGRRMVVPNPTFPSYFEYGKILGTEVVGVNLGPDFTLPVDELLRAAAQDNTGVLAVCNPNNPTGNLFPQENLLRLVAESDTLVVIDEAYFEYSQQTVVPYLEEYKNLLVMRTFSKAFAAAGVRIGYLLGDQEVIRELSKAKMPFNLGLFPQLAGQVLLKHKGYFTGLVEQISGERERLTAALRQLPGVTVWPSATNFILFATPQPSDTVWQALFERGVLVANSGKNPLLPNCLRVGVGSEKDNDTFLTTLQEILG